jgi:hypothetical protein
LLSLENTIATNQQQKIKAKQLTPGITYDHKTHSPYYSDRKLVTRKTIITTSIGKI